MADAATEGDALSLSLSPRAFSVRVGCEAIIEHLCFPMELDAFRGFCIAELTVEGLCIICRIFTRAL